MPLSRISSVAGELACAGRNISLRSASTSLIWRNTNSSPSITRRFDDEGRNTVGVAQEEIPASFVSEYISSRNLHRHSHELLGSALQPTRKLSQLARVTAEQRVLRHATAAEPQLLCNPSRTTKL